MLEIENELKGGWEGENKHAVNTFFSHLSLRKLDVKFIELLI